MLASNFCKALKTHFRFDVSTRKLIVQAHLKFLVLFVLKYLELITHKTKTQSQNSWQLVSLTSLCFGWQRFVLWNHEFFPYMFVAGTNLHLAICISFLCWLSQKKTYWYEGSKTLKFTSTLEWKNNYLQSSACML